MSPEERFRAARKDPALVVLEGFHPLKHAARFGAEILELVVHEDADLDSLVAELAPELGPRLADAARAPAATFGRLVPHPPTTGVVAIARRPTTDIDAAVASGKAPVIVLESPTRLGNLGAAVRVGAAVGADGLVALGRHDPWSPEAVRGGAGLQFALPVARLDSLGESSRPRVALTPAGRPLGSVPLPPAPLLLFGNERSGLSPELCRGAALEVSIPMQAGVSSLNLATAVAVVLYWWKLTGPPGLLHRAAPSSSR